MARLIASNQEIDIDKAKIIIQALTTTSTNWINPRIDVIVKYSKPDNKNTKQNARKVLRSPLTTIFLIINSLAVKSSLSSPIANFANNWFPLLGMSWNFEDWRTPYFLY